MCEEGHIVSDPNIDYYKVLSLKRNCDHLQIIDAFQEFLSKHDIENQQNKDVSMKFASVAEAYEVLSNPKLRLIYDNFGVKGLKKNIPEPYGWAETFVYHEEPLKTYEKFIGKSNLCSDLLNTTEELSLLENCQKPRIKRCKGENITKNLYLTLEEIYYGGLKKINIKRQVVVDESEGKTMLQDKTLPIAIKPGLPTGTAIIFPEKGNEAPYTIAGDIVFTTQDRPHDIFQRDGANLLMTVKVTLRESLLGTDIAVNTIDGRVIRMKITSVIDPDYRKIVSGEGLPLAENWRERGDLTISFKIEFPLYLNVSSKNDIKRAFTVATKYTAESDNEYIHRFILNDKMRKYEEPSIRSTE